MCLYHSACGTAAVGHLEMVTCPVRLPGVLGAAAGLLTPGQVFSCCPLSLLHRAPRVHGALLLGAAGGGGARLHCLLGLSRRRLLVRGRGVLLVGEPGADPRAQRAAPGPVHHHQPPLHGRAEELQIR